MSSPKSDRTEEMSGRKVPALVISGFLGSGKTTLIRHLLDEAVREGVRVALVSNELGELGIDRELLGEGGEAYVELDGGCVCCELSDDLLETLQELWERVEPDRIVIETSGVALPYDTQLNFWREPVCRWIGDDAALVVVNAEQVAEQRDLVGTFEDQVSSADMLVLNKIDLISQADLVSVQQRLRTIEAEAPVVLCSRGRIDPRLLFPPNAHELDRSGPPPEARPHSHESFKTREWQPQRGIDSRSLEAELARPGLLRAKGFVETNEGLRLVQVVGRRIELSVPERRPAPELIGRVVLISRAGSQA